MEQRSVTHSTFVLERTYDASPARVFAAWADPTIKPRWFGPPEEWGRDEFESDFRAGGRETSRGGPRGGPIHFYDARYQDIVPHQRIVLAYDMYLDDRRISVSLATVEIMPEGTDTHLIYTEQGAYLDGYDDAGEREHGTGELLDNLGRELQRQTASA